MYGYAEFIATLSEEQLGVVEYLDELMRTEFHLKRLIKYKIPFYEKEKSKTLFYLNSLKNGNLEMCFWSGLDMRLKFPQLEQKNRKMITGYQLEVNRDLDIEFIKAMVAHSIAIRPLFKKK